MALIVNQNIYITSKKASHMISALFGSPSLEYVSLLLEGCKSFKQVNGIYSVEKSSITVISDNKPCMTTESKGRRVLLTGVVRVFLNQVDYDEVTSTENKCDPSFVLTGMNRYVTCDDTFGLFDYKCNNNVVVPFRDYHQTKEYYESLLISFDDLIDFCVKSNVPMKSEFFYQLFYKCNLIQLFKNSINEEPLIPNIDYFIDIIKTKLNKNIESLFDQTLDKLESTNFFNTFTLPSMNINNFALVDHKKTSIPTVSKTINDMLEDDDIPTLMILASSLFDTAWKNLPKDMKRPTKTQLIHYIKTKQGILEEASIDAIIRISKPDEAKFGGKQSSDLRNWKPKEERK